VVALPLPSGKALEDDSEMGKLRSGDDIV